ncbi:hypothetical protein K6Y78_22250 [Burkholderia cenocepacia]|jgi:hypothetical protein|nr:hypothetical protein A3203_23050 [Burkholderia cenocepacia]MCW3585751.1 hypothetical protein [Burkholderia cenocepacia]MCW3630999.1 hypothetical protein [Burkholderia cenocepacia]NGO94113.1 hypothetical protein [Burkholderia cenocepacia]
MCKQARARLSVELGPLKREWDAYCAQRGLTPSEGLRQFVAKVIANATNQPQPHQPLPARQGPCKQIGIALTHAELARVKSAAYLDGFTANRWIVALIRAYLTDEPQLGNRELTLLAESNQQLAVIRRQLGELARHVNATGCIDGLDGEQIRATIDAHLRTVAKLLRRNLDRWSR